MSNNTSDIDLYAILELDPDATVETIKKAYKRLALQYHPDRPNGDTIKFQEIAMAYEILSNPEKRGEYDLLRQQRHSPQSHGLHSFYQKNTSFDPFDIFQEIFGEFLDFMILESSQFSSMPLGLEDILYMANMFGEGSIHIQRLEPMFEIAQRTVNLFQHGSPILQHSPTQIPLSSNISSALHPLQAPQLQPPKDLIQTITVDLREIYQGKTKKFNVTRLRFDDKIFKGKKMIEIPLFQKQIRIPKEGDWLPSWEGPGDLVINILATSALGFYRVNDFDLFTYHKVPLEEWYQGFTSVTLLDDTKITIDLAQQYQTLSETNFLLKMPNLGLPKSSSKESTCDRGYLYIQFILLPPGQQSTIADPSLILEILNYDE